MKYTPDSWYDWLVKQSKTDHIYSLIHNSLLLDLEINHDGDFVVLKKSTLPDDLKNVPEENISKGDGFKKKNDDLSDYILLDNNYLTAYLEAATRMDVIKNSKLENFIELEFTEEVMEYKKDDTSSIIAANVALQNLSYNETADLFCQFDFKGLPGFHFQKIFRSVFLLLTLKDGLKL